MDKLKIEGNELCKLILNLGVLDGQMADARRKVQDIDKQQVMIAVIAKLKEDDALGKVDELIGEDDMSASISALVELLEKHEAQLKDIGKADSDLKASVEARLGELAALLEKLQVRYDPDWHGFAFILCESLKSDDGSHDTFPDLHAPFQSTEASKLKMLLPALKTCYGILAGLATQSKASPGTLDQGRKTRPHGVNCAVGRCLLRNLCVFAGWSHECHRRPVEASQHRHWRLLPYSESLFGVGWAPAR